MVRASILAALGVALLAASAPQEQGSVQQPQTQQGIANSLERLAGAIENSQEPENYSADCQPGSERRDSDLCAQWKAADAASQSAFWTSQTFWLGVGGLLVGVFTLGAAIAAAIFAKKAADHTEAGATAARDAVKETKRIGEAQVRCYLSIANAFMALHNGNIPMITLRVNNAGQSPALNLSAKITLYWIDLKGRGLERQIVGGSGPVLSTIPAGAELHGLLYDLKDGFEPHELEQLLSGEPIIFLAANVRLKWVDVFGVEGKLAYTFIGAIPLPGEEGFWRLGSGEETLTAFQAEMTSRQKRRDEKADHPPPPDEGETAE